MKYSNLKMMTALSLAAVLALLPACSRENDHKEKGRDGHCSEKPGQKCSNETKSGEKNVK